MRRVFFDIRLSANCLLTFGVRLVYSAGVTTKGDLMPLKTTPTITTQKRVVNGYTVTNYCVYCGTQRGKGVKYYRSSETAAKLFATEFAKRVKSAGQAAAKLDAEQTYDAANALRMLSDAGVTLTLAETVRQWLESRSGVVSACSVGDAVASYLKTIPDYKEHHRTVRGILTKMLWADKDKAVTSVRRPVIESALSGIENPKTYNLTRGYVLAFLNWCQRNGRYPRPMYEECRNVAKRKVPYRRPEFYDAETVERVMRWCESHADAADIVPRFALGFFAGIRTDEVYRMKWGDIKFREGEIRVETPKGVDGTPPRLVTLQPNLRAWLLRYQMDDAVPVCGNEDRMAAYMAEMREALSLKWPRNVARHTFATMSVAMWRDEERTACDMGHSESSSMLRRHYLGVTPQDDAVRFWSILPKEVV